MILSRLLVRERLALLVALPLAALLVMTTPFVADQVTQARAATDTAAQVQASRAASRLVQELQRERLLSIAYLVGSGERSALAVQAGVVSDRLDAARALAQAADQRELLLALGVSELERARATIAQRTLSAPATFELYSRLIDRIITAAERAPSNQAPADAAVDAFASLIRTDEATSRAGAALLLAATGEAQARTALIEATVEEKSRAESFRRRATDEQVALFDQARNGSVEKRISGLVERVRTGR
ncbi:MAG TPA: nitrate- and nitrite sensing domain-containing protein, partial [Cryptosporangiaceae bacterium]|nr:nitrate- and nitrite sensing domain-containing protein [Cryptosporangiaceae bacterium]